MKSILVPSRKCLIVLAICSILSDLSKKRMIISVFWPLLQTYLKTGRAVPAWSCKPWFLIIIHWVQGTGLKEKVYILLSKSLKPFDQWNGDTWKKMIWLYKKSFGNWHKCYWQKWKKRVSSFNQGLFLYRNINVTRGCRFQSEGCVWRV